MEQGYTSNLKGQFLIAMPSLMDPNFNQTVTCLCEHNENGAIGIVINRVHDQFTCKNLYRELSIEYTENSAKRPVFLGGPVHIGEVFILHGPPFDWEGCLQITSTLAMSNTMDIMRAVAMDRGPESAIIALGCAGWGAQQLESEIRENAWLTCPVSDGIIFEEEIEARWSSAVRKLGIDPGLLTETPGHA